jgi:hypothetical protein
VQTSGGWQCGADSAASGISGDLNYQTNRPFYAVPSAAFCSLIVKVGTGPWHGLDAASDIMSDGSGMLYLTVNDLQPDVCPQPAGPTTCYTDNVGVVGVVVTVT